MDTPSVSAVIATLRVLHVTPYFAPAFAYGGPPRNVLGLTKALQRVGLEIRVLTTVAAGGHAQLPCTLDGFDLYENVAVHYAPLRRPTWYFNASLQPALNEMLDWCDICHVHGLWNVPEWQAIRAAVRKKKPYIVSPRGMLEPEALARGRWKKVVAWMALERGGLRGAAVLHATSEREADTLRARLPDSRVVMLPNGVDLEAAARATRGAFRAHHGLSATAPLVVALGRVHPIKRLDLIVQAVGCLRSAVPHLRLVIAGRDEAGERARLERLSMRWGGEPIWTGELGEDAKWSLLADATALVCCSDSESFGTSVAEACAAGVPAVVTQTCPWPILNERHCGKWVPQTAQALAEAISDICADPETARSMGERGRTLARECFTWPAIAAATADLYGKVVEMPRRVV